MAQELPDQCVLSSLDDDEPTVPRIAVPSRTLRRAARIVDARQQGTFCVSLDEHGFVRVAVSHQDALVLRPEEAFELLDFLFASRNLLALRSAEIAER